MEIKILYKERPGNLDNQVNHVYFTLDNKEFKLPILYIKQLRKNVFLGDAALKEFENYVKMHYDCEVEKVKDLFLYELRWYSNNRNLDPVCHYNLSEVKYKEMK